ncbi:MAG: M28 family peptidase [Sphingobacteriales bacterium]|nr:MAG: M28 family peptidase [Sphingobacteriales bacterium]
MRKTIDTLCSKYFAGRGYIDSGDTRAAKYIMRQFIKAGLKPGVKSQYFTQSFQMDVNTFPGKTDVILQSKTSNKTLKPGADFIVAPNSGGGNLLNLKLFYADSIIFSKIINNKKVKFPKGKFALVFESDVLAKFKLKGNLPEELIKGKASAIIEIKSGRLVWSVAHENLKIPYIEVAKNAFDKNAKTFSINIDQKLLEAYETQNIIGKYRSPKNPDSFIVFSAHYDHLGKMGNDAMFPGANDNAGGIAMLLDLARTYTSGKDTPKYSLLFIAFAAEEAGLIGSRYYTEVPVYPLENIKFLINMDLMGNGQDGMMAVNGSVFTKEYEKLVSINKKNNYLKEIKARGKAANSDHYWFTENGVHAFFFYLLGDYPYYHDIYDTAEKPTLKGYNGAFKLIRDFVKAL